MTRPDGDIVREPVQVPLKTRIFRSRSLLRSRAANLPDKEMIARNSNLLLFQENQYVIVGVTGNVNQLQCQRSEIEHLAVNCSHVRRN